MPRPVRQSRRLSRVSRRGPADFPRSRPARCPLRAVSVHGRGSPDGAARRLQPRARSGDSNGERPFASANRRGVRKNVSQGRPSAVGRRPRARPACAAAATSTRRIIAGKSASSWPSTRERMAWPASSAPVWRAGLSRAEETLAQVKVEKRYDGDLWMRAEPSARKVLYRQPEMALALGSVSFSCLHFPSGTPITSPWTGPNGAGKTTLVHEVARRIDPTARVLVIPPGAHRRAAPRRAFSIGLPRFA